MTTTEMWLIFGAAVAIVLLFSLACHKKFSAREISIIGFMAALSYVAYLFRIPFMGSGSSFHLGNTFTALTALLLDGVSGGLAGAIGLSIADIAAGDPGYAVTTFILKFIIGLVCGLVAHKVLHLHDRDPKSMPKVRYVGLVSAAAFSGLLVNVFTDPFLGYFRNRFIFGLDADITTAFAKIASGVTLVNSIVSCVCCVVLFLAIYPALKKARLLPGQKKENV